MKLKTRIKTSFKDMGQAFKNYPITIVTCFSLFLLLIVSNEGIFSRNLKFYIMATGLFIPLSLLAREATREFKLTKGKEVFLNLLGLGLVVLYYFYLARTDYSIEYIRYIGLNLSLYLGFFSLKSLREEDFSSYIVVSLGKFFIGGLFSLVLFLGLAFIFFSLKGLFNLSLGDYIYYYSFLFVSLVFFPNLFLSQLSKEEKYEDYIYPKALRGLFKYILIPLTIVYLSILYLYFLKSLLTRTFPQGLVSNLVLWYSLIVIIILFFIEKLRDQPIFKTYARLMPYLLIPASLLMFISMGIRIGQYGVTERRYLVLALGLWVLLSNLYLIFRKKIKTRFLLLSLMAILFISLLGPASSFSQAKKSQNRRMEEILEKNHMLHDGRIVMNKDIDREDRIEISRILEYFDYKYSLEAVDLLDSSFKMDDMEKVFGFGPEVSYEEGTSIYLSKNYGFLDLDGYEYFMEYREYESQTSFSQEGYDFRIDEEGRVKISKGDRSIYDGHLNTMASHVFEKLKGDYEDLDQRDLSYSFENEDISLKFLVKDMVHNKDNGETRVNNAYLLFSLRD